MAGMVCHGEMRLVTPKLPTKQCSILQSSDLAHQTWAKLLFDERNKNETTVEWTETVLVVDRNEIWPTPMVALARVRQYATR
jgi:uncharacterized protein involved in exopolysaccharide biosynthesis